jgi:uncharacterized C2H2 Zn-finger protein
MSKFSYNFSAKPQRTEIFNLHSNRRQTMSIEGDSSKLRKNRPWTTKVRCPLCGEELPTYSDYRKHLETKHSDFYLESRKGQKTLALAAVLLGVFSILYIGFENQPWNLLHSISLVLWIISLGFLFYVLRKYLLLMRKYKETLDLPT